ncbi:MAG: SusC/RagA family TonB-linked outer membrane protein [Prolixibacteraceae bacterium]|jgi:TonB-linked SusC/RagA family outer membrane protein|nr:SusC/RagA family TonB-linked outer membrane protein [Prolixibacteraceae bacterium]
MEKIDKSILKITVALLLITFGSSAFAQEVKAPQQETIIQDNHGQKTILDSLSEKVNIAFTSMQKKDMSSSVSTVKGEELEKSIHPNLQNAFIGRLSGLSIFTSNYEPGNSGYEAYVRGLKSTESNAPLILVDQVERDLSQLSANEVESVSVLKDAAALALYGSRGANGVILVTTKRGKVAPRLVTVDASTSLQETVGLRKYLNAYDFVSLYNKAWELDGKTSAFYSPEVVEGYKNTVENNSNANPYLYPNNNYIDEFINKYSYQKKVDVSMSGGNKDARYFALVSYLKQDGVFKYGDVNKDYSSNTNYQRFNFRSNIDINISSMASAFLDMAGRIEVRHYPGRSAGDIFNSLTTTPSNAYPIFNEDGSLGGTTSFQNNPYGLITQSGFTETMRRLFDATVGFKLDFTQWVNGLTFTARSGFDFNNFKNRGLQKNFMVFQYTPATESYEEYGDKDYSTFGSTITDQVYYNQMFGHAQFDYHRVFNDVHNITALALFDVNKRVIPGNIPSFKNVTFGAQVNYNYAHKYFLELIASTTANEAYMRGSRFGFYPAAALGWTITEEDFLKNNPSIDYLKLRTSFGLSGSDRPYGTDSDGRFLYFDEWSGGDGYSFGNPQDYIGGSIQSAVGNPKLRGEKAAKFNLGIDGELMNKQLYFTTDLYYEKRSGIWVMRDAWVPATYGASQPLENGGLTESKGWELTLGTKKTSGNFTYDVRLMADYSKSKILDMQEAPKLWDYQYSDGKQIREIWTLQSQGFFADDADIAEHATQTFGAVLPGDLKYTDYNEDGVVDENDKSASGKNSFPSWVFSLNTDISYKQFDFSMLWQGVSDQYGYDPMYEIPFLNKNASENAFDAWTPETASTAKYPRLTTKNFTNNTQGSDFWFVNNSYVRLKNIELGYSVSNAKLKEAGFESIRLFINGYNVLTLSHNSFDPEYPTAGIWQYPASRVFSAGLNITF